MHLLTSDACLCDSYIVRFVWFAAVHSTPAPPMLDGHFLIDTFEVFGVEFQNWEVIAVVAIVLALLFSLRSRNRPDDS
jgi:hypothetical protein